MEQWITEIGGPEVWVVTKLSFGTILAAVVLWVVFYSIDVYKRRILKATRVHTERRRHERIPFLQPVRVQIAENQELSFVGRDLSQSGIRLSGPCSLLGRRVPVRFAVTEGQNPCCFLTQFLWSCEVGDNQFENGGVFLDMAANESEQIQIINDIVIQYKAKVGQINRRRHPRFPFPRPVKVQTADNRELEFTGCDLSQSGIRLNGPASLLGEEARVQFSFADGEPPCSFRTHFLWSLATGDNRYDSGGVFVDLAGEAPEQVQLLLGKTAHHESTHHLACV